MGCSSGHRPGLAPAGAHCLGYLCHRWHHWRDCDHPHSCTDHRPCCGCSPRRQAQARWRLPAQQERKEACGGGGGVVLYQLGWIDENGNENNETSTADLMSLKPEVLAELDKSAMATCAQERVAMIGKMMEKKHKRCSKKFSEEDKAELMEMGLKIQGYNCFKEMFHSARQKSVKSQVYAFFQAQAMAAASTEAS